MVLALTLLFSASVFADTKVPYYVAVGDSMAGGYGLRGNDLEQLVRDTKFKESVVHNSAETSYPSQVAKRIYEYYGKEYTNNDFANLGAIGYKITDFEYVFGETDAAKLKDFINGYWTYNLPSFLSFVAPGSEINWDDYKWASSIVEELKTLNPDATIILVGMYNPFGDTNTLYGEECFFDELYEALSDNIFISKALFKEIAYCIIHNTLGRSASKAIDRLNEITKETAERNGLAYVDLTGAVSNEIRLAVHPNAAQHEEIAESIYAVIEQYLQ